jgi:hypothetical protein
MVALVLGPRDASAAPKPKITQKPAISGIARVGETLTSTPGAWDGPPPIEPTYAWLRCSASPPVKCVSIAGATKLTYVPVADDVGYALRIDLTVTNSSDTASAVSDPTGAIEAAPAPGPAPPPAPDPAPPPAPAPSPPPPAPSPPPPAQSPPEATPDAPPAPAPVPPPVATAPADLLPGFQAAVPPPPLLLDPFPVVRIRGRSTPQGARITLLTVRAPRRARVSVGCSGAGCPTRRWAHTAALTRVRAFERELRAGVRLTVNVTRSGWIGKQTVIVIRRSRAPLRHDRCLYPGSASPEPCPS